MSPQDSGSTQEKLFRPPVRHQPIAYSVGEDQQDLGGDYFDERQRERMVARAVQRIERLGYRVTLQPAC